jgi:hypothetical protein
MSATVRSTSAAPGVPATGSPERWTTKAVAER